MKLFNNIFTSFVSDRSFSESMKKLKCIDNNHKYQQYETIDFVKSEKHPKNNETYIFGIYIKRCKNCNSIYLDSGMCFREPL